ncbi:hypothetical protein HOY80DRAFT_962638, partial [Tuber brumale]
MVSVCTVFALIFWSPSLYKPFPCFPSIMTHKEGIAFWGTKGSREMNPKQVYSASVFSSLDYLDSSDLVGLPMP